MRLEYFCRARWNQALAGSPAVPVVQLDAEKIPAYAASGHQEPKAPLAGLIVTALVGQG